MNRRSALRTLGFSALAGWTGGPGLLSSPALAAQPPDGSTPEVELELLAAPGEIPLFPGAPTRVWRFTARLVRGPAGTVQPVEGSYLGPTLRFRRGQRVRIRFRNELGPAMKVIATGGLAEIIARETPVLEIIAPWLTLDGLRILWDLNHPL